MLVLGIQAQPAILSGPPPRTSLLVTNLLQLSRLLESSARVLAAIRLDVNVCSASRAEIGVIAVTDETGSEILELESRSVPLVAGDIIHLECQRCLFRKRELGIEITREPDLDNDGVHGARRVATEVSLKAGIHPFQLDYFNYLGAFDLELTCRLPDGSVQRAERLLVTAGNGAWPETNAGFGLTASVYEGEWLNLPEFTLLKPVSTVARTNLNPILGPQSALLGVRFKGFLSAPMDGNYSFNLISDDGSLLFLDGSDVPLTKIGHQAAPSPLITTLRASMLDSEAPKWMNVEGRVVFVSRSGRGLRFELQSQPDSISVTVADCKELDPLNLVNSRIRVSGIGRAVMTPNQGRLLGELSVATSDDIKIQADTSAAITLAGTAPTLRNIGKIQSLSIAAAARHLPVRIQCVVTSIAPPNFHYMSVQDETRGIFVRLSSSVKSSAVVGQLCEVVGHTDVGDFAPVVVADSVDLIGKGRMPSPAHPTWKELINGSMDVQWVELQGLVTAVHSNNLSLLLPEGELNVEVEGYSDSQLRFFESAVVRLQGVFFAAWKTNRTVQVGHLVMRDVTIGVDVPAPRDPFDVRLKTGSELYQFDSSATPFQRVKVQGIVIFADPKRVFLLDKVRGIRISPVTPADVKCGDEVEAVGYPDISGTAPLLREAIFRKTGRTVDPAPLKLDGSELMQAKAESMLVRITATLTGIHSEPDTRVLEMNANGHLFLARLPDKKESLSLQIGSRLALTGVYLGKNMTWSEADKPNGFELLLGSPSQLTVLSQPSWWTPQRLLAIVGMLVVILILAAVWISQLHRLVEQRTQLLQKETREREVAERERTLETERSRIARDLHDDLGSSLTEISVLAAKGQRLRTLDELTSLFRAIAAKARGLVTALDVIVWAVDPKDNTLESVADYLGDFTSEYLSHSGIICRFDIPIALPSIVLDGRLRHALLLAVKETLNNVERHSQATEVQFQMTLTDNQLDIVISDNGKGFDTKTKYKGNGLRNLPLRLTKLGGRYTIKSSVGNGTVVTIGLQLSSQMKAMPKAKKLEYDV